MDGMGVCCFGGGGSTPAGNTTTTSTSTPWANQIPYLQQIMSTGSNLYNSNNMGPYQNQGQTLSLNNNQITPLTEQYTTGTGGGTQALQSAASGISNVAGGGALNNPGSAALQPFANGSLTGNNPYMQQAMQSALATAMPSIEGQFAGAGRMDSGLAASAAAQGATAATGNLEYQNYAQTLQNQLQAAQSIGQNYTGDVGNQVKAGLVAPNIDAQTMSDYGTAGNLGNAQYQIGQQQLNDQIAQQNYGAMQPYTALGLYGQDIVGNGGTTTQTQPYYENSGANTLAGISGLLGMGSALNGLTSSTAVTSDGIPYQTGGIFQSIFNSL
jgi:hypothetical protein